jgi:hypothetical protein
MSDMDRRTVVDMVFGAFAAQVTATAANLKIADQLGDGERAGVEVAERIEADAGATTRLLRAMAAIGLVEEPKPGVFRLTGPGQLLRSDRPDSLHAFVRMFTDPAIQSSWRELDKAVLTGERVFDGIFGTDFFSYLGERPELSAVFNGAMRQGSALMARMLPTAYDFSRFGAVLDIGGGDGTLLSSVLAANPGVRGILFDTAEGLAQADEGLTKAGVRDRCELRTGDFFESVPAGADLYLIKSVLHDWNDEQCETILRNVRSAIGTDGRLMIMEPVLPETVDGSLPPQMYLSDLNMLVNLGGKERTATEFGDLCARSGFAVDKITPMPAPAVFSLIEVDPN